MRRYIRWFPCWGDGRLLRKIGRRTASSLRSPWVWWGPTSPASSSSSVPWLQTTRTPHPILYRLYKIFLFLDFLPQAVMVCFFFDTKMTRNLIKAKWNVLNVHINHGRVTAFLNERRRIVKMFRLNYFNSKCNLCLCVSRSDVSTTALGVKNALLHNKVFRWSLLSYTCWTMESGRFFILSFFRFDNSVTPH